MRLRNVLQIYIYNGRCTYRNSNSTTHKIATSVRHLYSALALETDIEGRCVSLEKARRKRRHDYPDAEVETERGMPHSLRRRRNIVAALKLPRPESVDQRSKKEASRFRNRLRKGDTIIGIYIYIYLYKEKSLPDVRLGW